jgi:TRAP-type uncharacterized transport system fused permease subunit
VLDSSGQGLLLMGSLKNLAKADWGEIAVVSVTAMIGIAALAGGMQNWLFKKTTVFERGTLILAGLLLVYPKPLFDYIGIALFALVIAMQRLRKTGDGDGKVVKNDHRSVRMQDKKRTEALCLKPE